MLISAATFNAESKVQAVGQHILPSLDLTYDYCCPLPSYSSSVDVRSRETRDCRGGGRQDG